MREERIIYIDLLRIISTFAVIMLHASAQNWYTTPVISFEWQIFNIYDSLVRWCVPIFIMISGSFMLEPIKPDNYNLYYFEAYKKILNKILRIFIALIFWGVTYQLGSRYIFGIDTFKVNYLFILIFKIFIVNPWYHLWYLYLIIGLYILTPLLRIYITNCERVGLEILIFLFFVFGTCIPFVNFIIQYFLKNSSLSISFNVLELSGYLGYYISGYYLLKYDLSNKIGQVQFSV